MHTRIRPAPPQMTQTRTNEQICKRMRLIHVREGKQICTNWVAGVVVYRTLMMMPNTILAMNRMSVPATQCSGYERSGKARCTDVRSRTQTAACASGTKLTTLFVYNEEVSRLDLLMSPRKRL